MTMERIFRRRFSESLLKTYVACLQIKNNSALLSRIKNHFENKAITTVFNLISKTAGASAKIISKTAGEEEVGQASGEFIESLIKGSGILYLLWKKKKEEDARRDAVNFLNFVDVDGWQEMKDVSQKLADDLYFHFKNGIDRLYYSKDKYNKSGVVVLAWFFAAAIIKKGMEIGDSVTDDERFKELLRAAIPDNEKDELYYNSFLSLSTATIKLKTEDEEKDKNWSIRGLLLRAPGKVLGEIIQLKYESSSKSPKKKDKYPAIIFRNSNEAMDWGFIIENEKEYAPLRVVKEPAGKFSVRNTVLYFFKSDCNFREWREDQLRMVVKKEGDKELEYIGSLLQNKDPIFNTNINGRGRANSLCSIANGLWDKTPLMIAAQEGQEETVKFLVEKGANFNMRDSKGYSAFDYAIRAGLATSDYDRKRKQAAIAEYLEGEGAFQFKTDSNHLENLKYDFAIMVERDKKKSTSSTASTSSSSDESEESTSGSSDEREELVLPSSTDTSPSPCPIDRLLSLGRRSRFPSQGI